MTTESKNPKCDSHSKELIEIRTEFNEYRRSTNLLLDEIIERIKEAVKPQFTTPQIAALLISALGYLAGIMIYVGSMNSDIRVVETKMESSESRDQVINLKLDRLLQDVAVLNSKNK
jgi:hypothetical protein